MDTKIIQGTLVGNPGRTLEFRLALPYIGRGGNACIYRAHAEDGTGGDNYNYIIKILKPKIQNMIIREDDTHIWLEPVSGYNTEAGGLSPEEILEHRKQLMLNEAKLMHEFQLESVCMNISAVFEYKNTLAVAMPCTGGKALSEEGRRAIGGAQDMIAVVRDIKQIADRILSIHAHGKLHMDISPDNIFRRADGALTILDLGSVCDVNTPVAMHSIKRGFCAPEVQDMRSVGIVNKQFGFETDIYSIGAVMYYIIFGKAFDHRMPGAYFFDCVDELPINEGAKEQLRYIFEMTLKFTALSRCNSAQLLINALNELEYLLAGFGVSPMRIFQRSYDALKRFFRQNRSIDKASSKYLVSFESFSNKLKCDSIFSDNKNVLIYGENGSGKTTMLMQMWSELLARHKQSRTAKIPLYIQLGNYPEDISWRNGNPNEYFVLRQICVSYYNAASLSECQPDILSGLAGEFSKETASPEYCLLADGLDEVKPEVRSLLLNEFGRLSKMSNLCIVVTSRYCDMTLSEFSVHNLNGLREQDIFTYMRQHGFTKRECNAFEFNRMLMKLIKYPMYLSLICRLHDLGQNTSDITRSGQLLYRYFISESGDGNSSELERIKRIAGGRSGSEAEIMAFLYRHYLPYIAFAMDVDLQKYSLEREEFDGITEAAFEYFSSADFLRANPESAEIIDLLYCFDGSFLKKTKCINNIIRIICSVQCVMEEQNHSLNFVNQTVKTFFAALHICNLMQVSVKRKNPGIMSKAFAKNRRSEITQMAGDILSDISRESDPIAQSFDLFRNCFSENYPLIIRNIILLNIAHRGNLDGCNLSRLDLTKSELVGISCRNAVFDNAKMTDETLLGLIGNIYTSAVSIALNKIALFSGGGEIILADPSAAEYNKVILDSECDMCIAAKYTDKQLLTLGRAYGHLTLCVEIYGIDGKLQKRIPVIAQNYNSSRQYQHVLAEFSADGKMLAVAKSPVYNVSDGELLLINCETGEQRSIELNENIRRIRFGINRLYLITTSYKAFYISPEDDYAINEDSRFEYLIDVTVCGGEELYMISENREIMLADKTERKKLNLKLNSRFMREAEFSFADCDEPICVCRIGSEEYSILAYFDDTPPRTVYADVISVCSPEYALISRKEPEFGEIRSYIGLYDIVRENWIVRVKKHRGMSCGMLSGHNLLMKRGVEAVICNTDSGSLRHFTLPEENIQTWISADGDVIMTEKRTPCGIELKKQCGDLTETIALKREQFSHEKRVDLSVLCVSDDMECIIVQAVSNKSKRLFAVKNSAAEPKEIMLADNSIGSTQAQLLSNGMLILLSEKRVNRQKNDILQIAYVDNRKPPYAADASEYRIKNAALILMSYDNCLSLVSFEYNPCDVSWRYGNAVITDFDYSSGDVAPVKTKKIPCCCPTNPRVDCRYMSTEQLILKRRYTDVDYIAIDIRNGEERHIYLDSVRLQGSSFRNVSGISPKCADIISKCGCII